MDASAVTVVRTWKDGRALGMTADADDRWVVYKRATEDGPWSKLETVAPFDSSGAARSWISFLTVYP